MIVPSRSRGKPTQAKNDKYNQDLNIFAQALIAFQKNVDFKISGRGWCYQLETFNAIDKSQFDDAEKIINVCRKNGLLPIDFTASDTRRAAKLIVYTDGEVEDTLDAWRESMMDSVGNYTPELLSDQTGIYIEVLVEKVDLVGLFTPVCKEYQIPISNISGWSDINSRAALLRRCNKKANRGKEVHILYCGDFDPGGLQISKTFMKNLNDLQDATGTDPSFIHFHRFGLNYEYIIENDLVWTDNLTTGSKVKNALPLDNPRHKNHNDAHVQDYIQKYGVRKVEANALLKDIAMARQLLRDEINKYITENELDEYEDSLIESRNDLKKSFEKLWDAA